MAPIRKKTLSATLNENAMFVVLGGFLVFVGGYALLRPKPQSAAPQAIQFGPNATTNTDIKPALRIDGTLYELNRIYVGAIQPTTFDADAGGEMVLRYLYIVAAPGKEATIGGLPPDASAGLVPAPIFIEDSILDRRVNIAPNVELGANVYYYP